MYRPVIRVGVSYILSLCRQAYPIDDTLFTISLDDAFIWKILMRGQDNSSVHDACAPFNWVSVLHSVRR